MLSTLNLLLIIETQGIVVSQNKPKVMLVDCPTCGKKSAFTPENRWRPFCSERCKLIDLGEWASEGYQIAAEPDIEDFSIGDTPEERPYTKH